MRVLSGSILGLALVLGVGDLSAGSMPQARSSPGQSPFAPPGELRFEIQAGTYQLRPEASELIYELRHPLHMVRGISRDLHGTLIIQEAPPYLRTPCQIKAPLSSFSSRNRNRDANALAALESWRFPYAEVLLQRVEMLPRAGIHSPQGSPRNSDGMVHGVVGLHGVLRPFTAKFQARASSRNFTIEAAFSLSLAAHGVERPQLLLLPVDDAVSIRCRLVADQL